MADWQPRYLIQKAPGVEGPPIPSDEPCLVIRGQDMLAPLMMSTYIERYKAMPGHDATVISELLSHLEQLILWQEAHPEKVKRADR